MLSLELQELEALVPELMGTLGWGEVELSGAGRGGQPADRGPGGRAGRQSQDEEDQGAEPLNGLPTTAAAPQTQPDQLIQLDLGRHQLLCGDATDLEQVARLMDGVQAQLAAADPPCGMAKERDGAANDNLRGEALGAFSTSWCFSTPRCSSS